MPEPAPKAEPSPPREVTPKPETKPQKEVTPPPPPAASAAAAAADLEERPGAEREEDKLSDEGLGASSDEVSDGSQVRVGLCAPFSFWGAVRVVVFFLVVLPFLTMLRPLNALCDRMLWLELCTDKCVPVVHGHYVQLFYVNVSYAVKC